MVAPPVKEVALAHGLNTVQPDSLKDPAFLGVLRGWSPDVIVVVSFRILPSEVIEVPARGVVNVHPSLLPRYRGSAPINWAIIRGESETGVTTFFIVPKVDSGSIILQRTVPIGPDETAGELSGRLKGVGAELLLDTLEHIDDGTAHPYPQCEHEVSLAPKLTKEDARIDWSEEAESIRNLIRGTNPWPGAFTTWQGEDLKVHRAAVAQGATEAHPGEIILADAKLGVKVAARQGGLWLAEIQPAGRRRMASAEWVRGHSVRAGDKLGE
jgi:methionyl-tRNA formyltransferase